MVVTSAHPATNQKKRSMGGTGDDLEIDLRDGGGQQAPETRKGLGDADRRAADFRRIGMRTHRVQVGLHAIDHGAADEAGGQQRELRCALPAPAARRWPPWPPRR